MRFFNASRILAMTYEYYLNEMRNKILNYKLVNLFLMRRGLRIPINFVSRKNE
ncbi:hypothetical protein LRA02_11430 [Lentilactobacillus rapi]|uniref:Uncharacterized protein n=1 Tax=Lentilactobacillus rapi TaxID=481723 RepID=A0A512PM56_9LACO|nr:hypothetical protein LRA02_11430 [Lentilactobacillus rapi]